MGAYTLETIGKLIRKINSLPERSNKVISSVLNEGADVAKDLGVDHIVNEVALSRSYVNGHLKVSRRATPSDLRVEIKTSTRNILLPRYNISKLSGGYKVSVNRRGGGGVIDKAWLATTRVSNRKALFVSNKQALLIARLNLRKGRGSTPGKVSKINALREAVSKKKYGMSVLSGRSMTQLFRTARRDISPEAENFMRNKYLVEIRKERG